MKLQPLILASSLALTSCSTFSKQSVGVNQADDLVSRVERVHVECELAQARLNEAIDMLNAVVDPNLMADPVLVFTEYVEAIDSSEEQAEALRDSVRPMKDSANEFFEQWARNLDLMANERLRDRSYGRLSATRKRYEAVLAAVGPVQSAYEAVNSQMRDHALFLEMDFNPAAMMEVQGDVQSLTRLSDKIQERLDTCLVTARDYIDAAALPVSVEMTSETQSEPESPRSTQEIRGRYR